MIARALIILVAILLFSCEEKNRYYEGYEQSIIVDGQIELNGYPKVFLTRNIPYYVNIDSADLPYMVLKQAKITVSDGETSEVLTLRMDKKEFPPYFYQGNVLTGKAGRVYTLTIDYGELKITSATSIPAPVLLDSVWFQANSAKDSLGKIYAKLTTAPGQAKFFRTYTRLPKQRTFVPTLISNFDGRLFQGSNFIFHLNKGPETFLSIENSDFYFRKGDTILLKICTVDEKPMLSGKAIRTK